MVSGAVKTSDTSHSIFSNLITSRTPLFFSNLWTLTIASLSTCVSLRGTTTYFANRTSLSTIMHSSTKGEGAGWTAMDENSYCKVEAKYCDGFLAFNSTAFTLIKLTRHSFTQYLTVFQQFSKRYKLHYLLPNNLKSGNYLLNDYHKYRREWKDPK